jgi:hypothetical protein
MPKIVDLESLPPSTPVPIPALAQRWGKSLRTLDRWKQDDAVGLPEFFYIRGRRHMKAGEALEWEKKLPSLSDANKRLTGYALQPKPPARDRAKIPDSA